MSAKDVALKILKEEGCELGAYFGVSQKAAEEDLKAYFKQHKNAKFNYTIPEIATELINIGVENRPYPEDGKNFEDVCPNGDICHWGFDELYPEPEKKLRELLQSKEPFDTGWLGSKKEIMSCRIQSDGKKIKLSVHQETDEFPDILGYYDIPGFDTEDEEKMEMYENIWMNGNEFMSEYDDFIEIPITTYETMLESLDELQSKLSEDIDQRLRDYGKLIGAVFND